MCMCMYAHVIWFPKVTARICSSEHARSASVRLRCREVGVCRGVDAEGACHLTVDCRFPSFAGLNEARPLWYTRQHGSAPGLGHQRILGGWAVKGRTASRLEHSGDSKLSLRRRRTTHELVLELTWVRVMCLDVLLGADAGLLAARAQAAAQQPWKTGSLLQPIVSLLQPPIILLASAAPRHTGRSSHIPSAPVCFVVSVFSV